MLFQRLIQFFDLDNHQNFDFATAPFCVYNVTRPFPHSTMCFIYYIILKFCRRNWFKISVWGHLQTTLSFRRVPRRWLIKWSLILIRNLDLESVSGLNKFRIFKFFWILFQYGLFIVKYYFEKHHTFGFIRVSPKLHWVISKWCLKFRFDEIKAKITLTT